MIEKCLKWIFLSRFNILEVYNFYKKHLTEHLTEHHGTLKTHTCTHIRNSGPPISKYSLSVQQWKDKLILGQA